MCTVSAIYDYGQFRIPDTQWNRPLLDQFTKLVNQAAEFDKAAEQPDCVDPDKEEWMKRIEERVSALEAAAFRAGAVKA